MTRYIVVTCAALLLTTGAFGQQVVTFEFSFSNPGARSMGFGGAFVALADDATAAYANPAGLVQLAEPEVSLEGRYWSYSTPFVAGGRVQGQPTGIGLDTTPDLRRGESDDELASLSFLSLVYPLRRWSIAFYRHQLANFEASIETQGLFADGTGFADTSRFPDQQGFSRTEIVSYGVSAGFRVTDSLSLGIGLTYQDAEHTRDGAAYLPDDESFDSFFGENSYLPERRIWEDSYESDDSDTSAIAGLLWRFAEGWSAGAVYRRGFEVEVDAERRTGPAIPADPPFGFRVTFTQAFPDIYGLGVAYRSGSARLTSSLEWDHVEYSDLSGSDPDETIPDADEIHVGAEYAFLQSRPTVAVRLGAWLDPDHRVRATQGDLFFRARLQPGDDEIHVGAGIGFRFKTFQLDLGADFSDNVNTASLSLIHSF